MEFCRHSSLCLGFTRLSGWKSCSEVTFIYLSSSDSHLPAPRRVVEFASRPSFDLNSPRKHLIGDSLCRYAKTSLLLTEINSNNEHISGCDLKVKMYLGLTLSPVVKCLENKFTLSRWFYLLHSTCIGWKMSFKIKTFLSCIRRVWIHFIFILINVYKGAWCVY